MQLCRRIGTTPSCPKFVRLIRIHEPRNTGINAQYIIIRRINIQLCIFLNYTFVQGKLQARIVQPAEIARPRWLVDFRLEAETV